jgi:Polysaccharide biosynthesis/export protein
MAWRDLAARFETGALQRAVERDVEAEIEAHLAEAAAALEAEGLAPDAARARARERFGDLDQIRAECLRIRMGGILAMNKLLAGALIVVTLALLATITGSYWLYTRARMAQDMAMAARMQAMEEAAERARESEAKSQPQEIVVEIGDSLELVETYGRVRLPTPAVVQSDGKALIPEAGWVDVAGLSREQVEQRLRERLAPFYEELNLFVVVHKPTLAHECIKAPITTFTSQLFGAF